MPANLSSILNNINIPEKLHIGLTEGARFNLHLSYFDTPHSSLRLESAASNLELRFPDSDSVISSTGE